MKSIVVGTAGHIDHGKSALVRALTGTDPDRLKEEQARGITIDLGFAHLETGGLNLAFVDVPGHERFVKNMLAGAGGIDLVMLVVAADESVMPQTREHFQICRLLQVPAGLIVLTKSDLADAETIELATLEVRELAAASFLAEAPVVAVSSKTGDGLDVLRATLVGLADQVRPRNADGPVRMPIDRVFSMKGFGTVVTGTLVSGVIADEQELQVLPRELTVKVRGVQVHGRREATAAAGRRVAVNIGGVEVADLTRGDTIVERGAFESTRRVDVALDLLPDARVLRHGSRVRFHQGTCEILGRVALSGEKVAGTFSEKVPATFSELQPGRSAYARLRLEGPAVVTRGDRFILRAYSPPVTIGGGVVLDPQPPRGAIRTPAAVERFRRIDREPALADDTALSTFITERGGAGFPRHAAVSRAGLSATAADAAIGRLIQAGLAVAVDTILVAPQILDDLRRRLLEALAAHHAEQPLSDGLPREEARERLFGRGAPAVFDHVVQRLVEEGRIHARERLALAGHQVALSPAEVRAREALERIFREARLTPPDLQAAAAAAGSEPAVAERMIGLLVRQKALVRIDSLLFHADSLAALKSDIRALKSGAAAAARVDVAAFKDRYGISRKYAIPLLEYLDRERVTRRMGDSRVVL